MSLATELDSRSGSFDELLLILRSDEGKAIGDLSNEVEITIDIPSGVDICVPSTPVTDQRSWSVILK
jgi:hypothetical protein